MGQAFHFLPASCYNRWIIFNSLLLRDKGREILMCRSTYAFTGFFFYEPWPEIESTTLAYQDDALTKWATQPGPSHSQLMWECYTSFLQFSSVISLGVFSTSVKLSPSLIISKSVCLLSKALVFILVSTCALTLNFSEGKYEMASNRLKQQLMSSSGYT